MPCLAKLYEADNSFALILFIMRYMFMIDLMPVAFLLFRPKKLRFHPKQLYISAKQGELQKVLMMLGKMLSSYSAT